MYEYQVVISNVSYLTVRADNEDDARALVDQKLDDAAQDTMTQLYENSTGWNITDVNNQVEE